MNKQTLIPYRKKDKWGFCNSEKEIIISIEYSLVHPFEFGLSVVEKNNFKGVINLEGKPILNCEFEAVRVCSKNLLIVKDSGKFGTRSLENKVVISSKYDDLIKGTEDLLLAKKFQKWGVIDRNEKVIVEFKYEKIGIINDSICPVKLDGKWGFLFLNGLKLIPCIYLNVGSFSDGLCSVKLEEGGDWGFINKEGMLVLPYRYKHGPFYFTENVSIVRNESGKELIIDKTGEPISIYENIGRILGTFSEGLAPFALNDYNNFSLGLKSQIGLQKQYGFIQKDSRVKLYPKYIENSIGKFSGGISQICQSYYEPDESDTFSYIYYDIIGYIDVEGRQYWEDGDSPEYYFEKYRNKKSRYENLAYKIYLLTKCIMQFPDSPLAYRERGVIIINNYKGYANINVEAVKVGLHDFEKAIQLESENSTNYYWKAISLMLINEIDDAIINMTIAIRLNSIKLEYYFQRGVFFHRKKKFKEALLDYSHLYENRTDLDIFTILDLRLLRVDAKRTLNDATYNIELDNFNSFIRDNKFSNDFDFAGRLKRILYIYSE